MTTLPLALIPILGTWLLAAALTAITLRRHTADWHLTAATIPILLIGCSGAIITQL